MWKIIYLLFLCVLLVHSKCPEKWSLFPTENNQYKCIKYFDHPVNFSEAQYICNEIYSGDLISINSLSEQKSLLQYLHNEIGFKRSPVTWLGGRILSAADQKLNENIPLKWIDGNQPKFDNFGENFVMDEILLRLFNLGTEKCTKILSLVAKGKQSTGLWTADNCSLRDSGFVCQLPYVEDRGRSDGKSGPVIDNGKTQFVIKQLVDQFNLIKELCESQIKLIEKMTNQFQLTIQSLSNRVNNDEF